MSLKLVEAVLVTIALIDCSLAHNRIVGGRNAADGQFPHQISLRRNRSHVCGGSIISHKHVLTAAHCVVFKGGTTPFPANVYSILAGSTNRASGGVEVAVSRIQIHENYGNYLNDLAVLTLANPLPLSNRIAQISLETKEIPNDAQVIISGWGNISTNGSASLQLQYNILKAVTGRGCLGYSGVSDVSVLCLSHTTNNGACFGDSGGPATYNGKLVGVTGFVVGGCGTTNPDGYAKVSHHVRWIQRNAV